MVSLVCPLNERLNILQRKKKGGGEVGVQFSEDKDFSLELQAKNIPLYIGDYATNQNTTHLHQKKGQLHIYPLEFKVYVQKCVYRPEFHEKVPIILAC